MAELVWGDALQNAQGDRRRLERGGGWGRGSRNGCGSKLKRRGYAGFGPCFHLPGQPIFGTVFLSHCQIHSLGAFWLCAPGLGPANPSTLELKRHAICILHIQCRTPFEVRDAYGLDAKVELSAAGMIYCDVLIAEQFSHFPN